MKHFMYIGLSLFLGQAFLVAGQIPVQAYVNQVNSIQEIHGATTYTVILTCEFANPIITYAPASFAESQNDTVYRLILPSTTLADDVTPSEIISQVGSGVELVLFGSLISKTISGNQIMISMKVA